LSDIKFSGHTYKCPNCGEPIDGYWDYFWKTPKGKTYQGNRPDEDSDEDDDLFEIIEMAGCVKCLDCWEAKTLQDITEVKVILT
jgi:hypothetical protein